MKTRIKPTATYTPKLRVANAGSFFLIIMLTALPCYGQSSQHASDHSLKSATKLRSLQKRSLEFLEFPVAQVPDPIHAQDRASYHRWMIEKAAELKALRLRIPSQEDRFPIPGLSKKRTFTPEEMKQFRQQWNTFFSDPQMLDIDWASFFPSFDEPFSFPEMMALNHSWFYWKELLNVNDAGPVSNVIQNEQPANSAFFLHTDIATYSPSWIREENDYIVPQGKITFLREKTKGTSEGFFGKDVRGIEYVFIFDPPFNPEMVTSAEYISSTLTRMAGYPVPQTAVTRVQGTGVAHYDGRRAVATIALKGFQKGWTYRKKRNRREIRGLRVFAAWLHNVDQSSHNTAHSLSNTGLPVPYLLDFGASLGSFTFRSKWPKLGEHYLFAPTDSLLPVLTDLEWSDPFRIESPAVGYFPGVFEPQRWKTFFRNFAFESATRKDNAWGAGLLVQFKKEQLRTIIDLAQFSNSKDAEYVLETLIQRRNQLTEKYLDSFSLSDSNLFSESENSE